MIRALAGDAVVLAAGHGVLRLAGGRTKWPFGIVGGVGASFLAGTAALGTTVSAAAVAGASTRPFPFIAPPLLVLAVAGLFKLAHAERPGRPSAAILAGVAGVAVTSWVGVAASRMIVGRNDEYAIWALKGRALALAGALDLRLFARPRAYWYAHLDYPLLVPGLVAWSDGWAGHVADGPAHVQPVLLLGALLAVVAWAVARMAGAVAAAVAVILVVTVHGLAATTILLYADVPVVSFAAATALFLAVWQDGRERAVIVAATATAAGALLSKNEGLLFVLAAFVAAAFVARGGRRRLAAALGVAFVAWAPWFVFVRAHGLHDTDLDFGALTPSRLASHVDRLHVIAHGLAQYWPGFGWTGIGIFLAATGAAVLAGRARLAAQWWITILAAFAGLTLTYWISALGLAGLIGASAPRVELFPAVALAIGCPLLAGAAVRARSVGGRASS